MKTSFSGERDRQTDRQTHTQTDRHRQTDRQTDRQAELAVPSKINAKDPALEILPFFVSINFIQTLT